MRIGIRLALMGSVSMAVVLAVVTGVSLWLSNSMVEQAKKELQAQARKDLVRQTESLYLTVLSQGIKGDRNAAKTILSRMKVGDSGYIWILGGSGSNRGCYILSKGGKRDGESIWNSTDPSGRYVIREMVEGAKALPDGGVFVYRYPWQNVGESSARWKMAAVVYYLNP